MISADTNSVRRRHASNKITYIIRAQTLSLVSSLYVWKNRITQEPSVWRVYINTRVSALESALTSVDDAQRVALHMLSISYDVSERWNNGQAMRNAF